MNKYVLRTSLIWFRVLALVVAIFLYREHPLKRTISNEAEPEPIASGPAVKPGDTTAGSVQKTAASLAPVQLTPEGMQSIGFRTGIVEQADQR